MWGSRPQYDQGAALKVVLMTLYDIIMYYYIYNIYIIIYFF